MGFQMWRLLCSPIERSAESDVWVKLRYENVCDNSR